MENNKSNATIGLALFGSGALLLVGAHVPGAHSATSTFGDETPENFVFVCKGFS